ncbi:hypothetical protein J4G48_0049340 (plasmid) [Bradyrhizobium barranii subsp. apii]|uniref:hypothetical protein n=1 Tax=Bradyrhizobium barranii TaxID=2992140 RepID=UPI001AA10070|nr:hypothetical protein [Bradyrhizobium barranii]UPU01409.1 hypothetical protein J4G48_0049340 [Bradyrhizobium barranii subsp. apii]
MQEDAASCPDFKPGFAKFEVRYFMPNHGFEGTWLIALSSTLIETDDDRIAGRRHAFSGFQRVTVLRSVQEARLRTQGRTCRDLLQRRSDGIEGRIHGKSFEFRRGMPNYHPPAFRFLMAFEDIASPLVTKYDPEKDDGPLRRVDGTWRWHPDFCSEFMVADDFPLSDISGLDFVRHHQGYCRTKPDCVEKIADPSPQTTSGKLLSYVLAHGVHDLDKHMQPDGNGRNRLLDMASAWLSIVFNQVEYAGSVASNEDCDSVVKGALALFAVDKMDDGKRLLKLIAGSAQAVSALTRLIRIHFGSPTWDFGL